MNFISAMGKSRRACVWGISTLLAVWCLVPLSALAANVLDWNRSQNSVSADIQSGPLQPTLKQISASAGWQVFLEPNTTRNISAKFKDLPPGDALRLLLGDLNYALVPDPDGLLRLYVFRTSRQNATERLTPAELLKKAGAAQSKAIKNELVVRLKKGAKIDDWARLVGAKVTGRIDGLNAYRLEFENEEAADSARQQLAASSDVESVENNYSIERPTVPEQAAGDQLPPRVRLQLNPPPDNGKIVIGLIDTGVQTLGGDLDKFLLKQITVGGQGAADSSSPSHGTSMAGTILRSLEDITKGRTSVQILPVDVYGSAQNTSTFSVSQGIVEAVNGGAKIINLSLGSDADDSVLRSVLADAASKNIVVFAAAGNQPVTTPVYPAAYPGVNAVTALDHGQIASYANRGAFVSYAVPGTSIVYYNDRAYSVVGTSAASAAASGFAAGYLDSTKSSTSQMLSFMRNNFGVTISTVPKKGN